MKDRDCYLKIGNTSFFTPHFVGMKKERFKEIYQGTPDLDLENAFFRIGEHNEKLGLTGKEKYQDKSLKIELENKDASIDRPKGKSKKGKRGLSNEATPSK